MSLVTKACIDISFTTICGFIYLLRTPQISVASVETFLDGIPLRSRPRLLPARLWSCESDHKQQDVLYSENIVKAWQDYYVIASSKYYGLKLGSCTNDRFDGLFGEPHVKDKVPNCEANHTLY